jgi:hypothetical protein
MTSTRSRCCSRVGGRRGGPARGTGVGTVRAIARACSAFVEGGAELGITPQTFARVVAPPAVTAALDAVPGLPSCLSLAVGRRSGLHGRTKTGAHRP